MPFCLGLLGQQYGFVRTYFPDCRRNDPFSDGSDGERSCDRDDAWQCTDAADQHLCVLWQRESASARFTQFVSQPS